MKKTVLRTAFAALAACTLLFAAACSNSSDSGSSNGTSGGSSSSDEIKGTTMTEAEIAEKLSAAKTIWEGSQEFTCDENFANWEGNIMFSFKNVSAGDLILITHEKGSTYDYGRALEMQGYGWQKGYLMHAGDVINCNKKILEADTTRDIPERGSLYPWTGTQTTGFYVSANDATIINSSGGLTLYGSGLVIKKIAVVSDTATIYKNRLLKKSGWALSMDFRNNSQLSTNERFHIELIHQDVSPNFLEYLTDQSKHLEWSGNYTLYNGSLSITTLQQEIRTEGTESDHNELFADENGPIYIKLTTSNVGALVATYNEQEKTILFTSLPDALAEYIETDALYLVE